MDDPKSKGKQNTNELKREQTYTCNDTVTICYLYPLICMCRRTERL